MGFFLSLLGRLLFEGHLLVFLGGDLPLDGLLVAGWLLSLLGRLLVVGLFFMSSISPGGPLVEGHLLAFLGGDLSLTGDLVLGLVGFSFLGVFLVWIA